MLRPSWHVEPWEVDFDRRDRAGRGGFGEVFLGHWAGQQAAVKEAPWLGGGWGWLGMGSRGGGQGNLWKTFCGDLAKMAELIESDFQLCEFTW